LINWIERALRIRKHSFTLADVNKIFSIKANISIKHIEEMIKLNIIEESYEKTNEGFTIYNIVDPKIKFLISRGILKLDQ